MRIIHLSDFHLEYEYITHADYIILQLTKVLTIINKEQPIDLIFCSGDILHKFGKSFKNAQIGYYYFHHHVIVPICKRLKLRESHFFIVPGNHDLDIGNIQQIIQKQIADINDIQTLIDLLSNEFIIRDFTNRAHHFLEFQRALLSSDENIFFEQDVFQTNVRLNTNEGVVGISLLNTSLGYFNVVTPDNHIVLNIKKIIESSSFIKDCSLKLMIGHHNYNAVKEFELSLMGYITTNYDAYFCGHTHGLSEYNVHKRDDCFIFRAPCILTNTSSFSSNEHLNGFLKIDLYNKPLTSAVTMYYQDNKGNFSKKSHIQ